jgi:hypothetical protein
MAFLTQLLHGYQKILVTHTVTSKPSGMWDYFASMFVNVLDDTEFASQFILCRMLRCLAVSCNWQTIWSESHIHTTTSNRQCNRITRQIVTVGVPKNQDCFWHFDCHPVFFKLLVPGHVMALCLLQVSFNNAVNY